MPGWLVISLVVAAAIGILSLIWWSSGRARLDRGGKGGRSATERFETDVNRIRTMRNRDGFGGSF